MKTLLVRELVEGSSTGPVKVLSVFLVDGDISLDQFDSELSSVLAQSNLFERLHVVGHLEDVRRASEWLRPGEVLTKY
jgi:hypothetical protein